MTILLGSALFSGPTEMYTRSIQCSRAFDLEEWMDLPAKNPYCTQPPRDDELTILLSAQAEVDQAKFDRPSPVVSTIYCDKLKKAHEIVSARGVLVGPIQDGGDMEFFEIHDTEGHLIQVCKEP